MSEIPVSPTGISIEYVWTHALQFEDRGFDTFVTGKEKADAHQSEEIEFGGDLEAWFSEPDPEKGRSAILVITMEVGPKTEHAYRAKVSIAGIFSEKPGASLKLEEYLPFNGVAQLVPFAREKLMSLTGDSRYPTFILPPLDVREFGRKMADRSSSEVGQQE